MKAEQTVNRNTTQARQATGHLRAGWPARALGDPLRLSPLLCKSSGTGHRQDPFLARREPFFVVGCFDERRWIKFQQKGHEGGVSNEVGKKRPLVFSLLNSKVELNIPDVDESGAFRVIDSGLGFPSRGFQTEYKFHQKFAWTMEEAPGNRKDSHDSNLAKDDDAVARLPCSDSLSVSGGHRTSQSDS
jgi:hypothetical protein